MQVVQLRVRPITSPATEATIPRDPSGIGGTKAVLLSLLPGQILIVSSKDGGDALSGIVGQVDLDLLELGRHDVHLI